MMTTADGVLALVPDKLYALCNPYAVEGRVSTHPLGAQGYACMNCYVLVEREDALLVDTGMSVHQERILAQLAGLLGESRTLSVLPLRFGEFNALANARPIADCFPLRSVYGNALGEAAQWLDFRPGFSPLGGGLIGVSSPAVLTNGHISIDAADSRRLTILTPPIRLLPGLWAYDAGTRTLFTSDLFTWVWRSTPDGSWLVEAGDDPSTEDEVHDFLVGNRYWWLAGARTGRLRQDLAKVFGDHDIDRIAPGYGCVISGATAVEHHYRMLDNVLARFPHEPATVHVSSPRAGSQP